MSEFSTLKEEIVQWATSNVAMKKFTTHDVYDNIHSAETPSKASDALRRLHKEGVLDREEFMDGKMKKFIYSLKDVKAENKQTIIGKLGSDFGKSMLGSASEIINDFKDSNNKQQIEIPNNFIVELRSPNGFVITIKSSDKNDEQN